MNSISSTPGLKIPWQTLLLAASILNSRYLLTRAQSTTGILIKVDPETLIEGQNVTLTPGVVDLKLFVTCSWYQRTIDERNKIFTYYLLPSPRQLNGPAFTGRETGATDCSLRITNSRASDSAIYTLRVEGPTGFEMGDASLTVSEDKTDPEGSLTTGKIVGIVIGCVLGAALIAGLLYFLLTKTSLGHKGSPFANRPIQERFHVQGSMTLKTTGMAKDTRRKRNRTSTQIISAMPLYENISPSKVVPTSSSETDHVYQTLQHGDQAIYNELRPNPSKASSAKPSL
ncbi:carcinoembryonic antigen-related cell adhesion molecule 1-like [Rhineura floridana]|uniref:carcinoembryonic antigen-related cell adhesion molecule 1-like n=1 Tax=Rhineura floridana TaxID=261503 RepID=UPI002AC83EBA|nr:carcinoembryonic antigen-related cell adhesion molecule 1-like [Rhineura floridana]